MALKAARQALILKRASSLRSRRGAQLDEHNRRPGPLAIPLRTSENWRPSVAGLQRACSWQTNVRHRTLVPSLAPHIRRIIDLLAIDFQLYKVRVKGPVLDAVETLIPELRSLYGAIRIPCVANIDRPLN